MRVPWSARISNQSILKEITPEYSLEGLMLKLKLQYFGSLMRRTDHLKRLWCWERLKAGGGGDDRGWDGWMASPTQWTWVLSKLPKLVMDRASWRAAVHGVAKSWTRLSIWTGYSVLPPRQVFWKHIKGRKGLEHAFWMKGPRKENFGWVI